MNSKQTNINSSKFIVNYVHHNITMTASNFRDRTTLKYAIEFYILYIPVKDGITLIESSK